MRTTLPARIPAGLLGTLAIVFALEGEVFRRDRFTTDQAESWRLKGRWAVERAPGADTLVFGDSLLEFGVLPAVIADRAGRRALNLALHDGSPPASYFLLRRALEAGAAPSAILVDFMPHQLARGPGHAGSERSWPGLLSAADAFDLAWTMGDPAFFARVMAGQALRCLAARHEVRASILAGLRGEGEAARQQASLLRRHWAANLGAHVIPEAATRRVGPPGDLFPATWRCDPTTATYVRRFLDLARSRGIPVYWVIPPLRPAVGAWRDRLGLDAPYLAYIAGLQADHPGLTVLDGRPAGYDDPLFVDAVHLNRRGAEALSASVAEILRAEGPRGGRVALPRPPDSIGRTRGVEDLWESRAALRREVAAAARGVEAR